MTFIRPITSKFRRENDFYKTNHSQIHEIRTITFRTTLSCISILYASLIKYKSFQYAGTSGLDRFVALLEILTVLPEEYQTSRLDKARRREVRNGLSRGAEPVLQLLQQGLFQKNESKT